MQYVVGIMLTSFGTFSTGEGIDGRWWGNDLSPYGARTLVAPIAQR